MREMGQEFAQQHPKIAGRLGMQGIEVADPYVERLLEGFSFLTARIQMKMDAQYPQLTQSLLDVLSPSYTAPLPSMTVVQCTPSFTHGNLAKGVNVPRGTVLRGRVPKGEQTAPEFTTAQDVQLTPLHVEAVNTSVLDDGLKQVWAQSKHGRDAPVTSIQRVLTLRFSLQGGVLLKELRLPQLMMYLHGQSHAMQALLAWIMTQTVGLICHDAERPLRWAHALAPSALQQEGFQENQALLPVEMRQFQGHRVLQEYFALPERFLFFSVNGLAQALRLPPALANLDDPLQREQQPRQFCISFLLAQAAPEIESRLQPEQFALHCTPAINLVQRQADRIVMQSDAHRYHLVVDKTRPLDFEVYSIEHLHAYALQDGVREQVFRPFYQNRASDIGNGGRYFSTQRQDRLPSAYSSQQQGERSQYVGSEVYLQLVDQSQAPFAPELRHLAAMVWCSNRDLPLLMPYGSEQDFVFKTISAPVNGIRILRAPTAPQPALAQGEYAWRLIGQLEQQYIGLETLSAQQSVAYLRSLLQLHAHHAPSHFSLLPQAIQDVRTEVIHQRLAIPGPIVYGRGVRISITVDERTLAGDSAYLLGAVLEYYLSRNVGINMLVQCELHSVQRGRIKQWPVRGGSRPQF